jgi:hypothetical protein
VKDSLKYNLDEVVIFPNPCKEWVTVSNLPHNVIIRVYNIAGELIKEELNISVEWCWNLRNRWGREVASGIYLILIKSEYETMIKKIAVIR